MQTLEASQVPAVDVDLHCVPVSHIFHLMDVIVGRGQARHHACAVFENLLHLKFGVARLRAVIQTAEACLLDLVFRNTNKTSAVRVVGLRHIARPPHDRRDVEAGCPVEHVAP